LNHSIKLSDRRILLVIVDLSIILVTTLFSLWIHARGLKSLTFNLAYLADQSGWLILLATLWILAAYINGLYDPVKSGALDQTLLFLLRSGTIVMIVYLLIFFYAAPRLILPRGIVVYQVVSGFILIMLWRLLYIYLLGSSRFSRKILIVGAGWAGKTIAAAILETASTQYQIIGFIDDDPEIIGTELRIQFPEVVNRSNRKQENDLEKKVEVNIPVIGSSSDLIRIVKEQAVPEVVLAITNNMNTSTFRALMDCKELAIGITLMTELYENLTGRVPIEHIGENWFTSLPMESAETSVFYAAASRFFDLLSASLGLLILLPFFPFIALAIYLDSPGPIFYKQERVGKGGKNFNLYKLRTMVPDAEIEGQAQRAQQEDPRITRVGRWLRKFRLDEMPQLINILKGDMSAVGPRPERPSHLIELDEKVPFHRLRNAIKPGMAGWAVINFGYIDDLESAKVRLQYDLYYVKHQSLMLDMLILFRTFGQVILLRGR
jgi:lipopolysaccharide/colanic/teichoic acid biosynthesis glycosyltransferase